MLPDPLLSPLLDGNRRALARAITLCESALAADQSRAAQLLAALLPHTGQSLRLGVSGVPGVGKSTFIEALGTRLTEAGQRLAVLAIDPSSLISGGAILGDKTRMAQLAANPRAFIRPSPSSGVLGGVGGHTREAILLCEAAGFDVIIVETVGVGQSEIAVAQMTDLMVLLLLAQAGDDLQAIKKGIMEFADLVVFNKADLDPQRARSALLMAQAALALSADHVQALPPVLALSATRGDGLADFWQTVENLRVEKLASGAWQNRRAAQTLTWFDERLAHQLQQRFVATMQPQLAAQRQAIRHNQASPLTAAEQILDHFFKEHDRHASHTRTT